MPINFPREQTETIKVLWAAVRLVEEKRGFSKGHSKRVAELVRLSTDKLGRIEKLLGISDSSSGQPPASQDRTPPQSMVKATAAAHGSNNRWWSGAGHP